MDTPCIILLPPPKEDDVKYLDSDPGRVLSRAYDMVINGTEDRGWFDPYPPVGICNRCVFAALGIDRRGIP